jgi:hypothetical protein
VILELRNILFMESDFMAHAQRITKPENYRYGDVWNKFFWKCTKCNTVYYERWKAQACCVSQEGSVVA